jgi:L-iditol 2-dehydrogenase
MTEFSQAAVLDKPNGSFTLEEARVPDPGPGELVVRIELCGICGTDAHMYHGKFPWVSYPVVLGHEPVGIIHKLGDGVTHDFTGRPVQEGDRVYILGGSCGRCYFCAVIGRPNMCEQLVGLGFNSWPDEEPLLQGGYAQYVHITDPTVAFLRMDVDADTAVALEPFTIGVHAAERAGLRIGSTVVVQGSGAIGLFTAAAAREQGAHKVIVIGAPATRLALAREFGADVVISIEEVRDPQARVEMVKAETPGGHGADVVFECTGVPAAVPEGIDMTRRAGTYVVAGHYSDAGTVPINPFYITIRDLTIVGIRASALTHWVRARPLLEAQEYPFAQMISHKVPLERVGDAIGAMTGDYRLDGEEIRKLAVAPFGA